MKEEADKKLVEELKNQQLEQKVVNDNQLSGQKTPKIETPKSRTSQHYGTPILKKERLQDEIRQ